ncbi:unnamed protein product [Candidula unifasciata]|uniref:Ricin B lectin domain-containing protein n=1 Tax=Candidula unifasciata TaxID=100452 RepID=A0A8S3YR40_9EUPU|nr:unnamed protein product [Candidula unifasciata]
MIPFSLTDDVIITTNTNLSRTFTETVEEFVDLCPVCRLLFLPGTIYKQWNEAAKFARSKYLVFLDARISFSNNSLQAMIRCLQGGDNNTVVSPQLRLRYADGRGHNVGLSINEISWDLGVSRGAVSYQLLQTAHKFGDGCVNQTAIFKEVFGIRKRFFADLGGFDILTDASGGEHVTFSLKVLSCHGNIVTSLCSTAYLTIANNAGRLDNRKSPKSSVLEDYHNPTFDTNHTSILAYYIAGSKPWLDTFSTKYYTCALSRRIPANIQTTLFRKPSRFTQTSISNRMTFDLNRYLNSRYGYYGYNFKQSLMKSKCQVGHFRYIITQRQRQMRPPTKFATFYGYIRTLDGMYAFGRPVEIPGSDTELPELGVHFQKQIALIPEQGTFILTRNTSLWIGPFSFTNGAFIYNNIWCLTVSTSFSLTLQKCLKGDANQLFTFSNNIITLLGLPANCVGARRSSNVSSEIVLSSCSDQNRLRHFKLDIEFFEKCIK